MVMFAKIWNQSGSFVDAQSVHAGKLDSREGIVRGSAANPLR